MTANDNVSVEHREAERRYVLLLGGEHAGELVYRDRSGGVLAFLHTEVDPERQRRGLGSALVRGALEDVAERGLKVAAVCPFVEAYVRHHPEYAGLTVADPARRSNDPPATPQTEPSAR